MRRTLIGALVLSVALTAFAGSPAFAKHRMVNATYNFDLSKPGGSAWFGEDYGVIFGDAVTFKTVRSDRTVDLVVADDSATAVSAAVWQEGSPAQVFCGGIQGVKVKGGKPLFVQVIIDANAPQTENGCVGAEPPTTGRVEAMFM